MNEFRIQRNDRVFLVGATGSGKTTLAKAILWGEPSVVVLDPKHTFTVPAAWPGGSMIFQDLGKMASHTGNEMRIYRPSYEEMQNRCDDFFMWVFDRRDTILYVDEVISVTPGGRIGYGYAQCIQLGRERGIGTWSATQRPALVPLITMTEAQHMFVFRLKNPVDRKRMADYADPELGGVVRHPNGFYYYNERTGRVRYYRQANVGKVLEK